jgi:hypothetical protein
MNNVLSLPYFLIVLYLWNSIQTFNQFYLFYDHHWSFTFLYSSLPKIKNLLYFCKRQQQLIELNLSSRNHIEFLLPDYLSWLSTYLEEFFKSFFVYLMSRIFLQDDERRRFFYRLWPFLNIIEIEVTS